MIRNIIKTQAKTLESLMAQAPAHDPVLMDEARTLLAEAVQKATQALTVPKTGA